jgi:hypothetical protein
MSHCVWIPKTEDALLRGLLGLWWMNGLGWSFGIKLSGGIYWGACVSECVLVRGTLGNRSMIDQRWTHWSGVGVWSVVQPSTLNQFPRRLILGNPAQAKL